MHHRIIIFIVTTSFVLVNCRPPKGWRNNSYIYNSSSRRLSSSDVVRVKLFSGKAMAVYSKSRYIFKSKSGSSKNGKGKFRIASEGEFISSDDLFKFKNKFYQGRLQVYRKGKGFLYVNIVPLEEYIVSVISHEMNKKWPLEALKAQAVVARSYVIAKMNAKAADKRNPYDVDTTTKNQVYGGWIKDPQNAYKAVKETRGQVVSYQGKLAQTFFYSSCGGRTADSSEVWKAKLPYLISKKSGFCKRAPVYKWQISIPKKVVAKRLGLVGLHGLKVHERTESKRVKSVVVAAAKGNFTITGAKFRAKMGAKHLKSTMFDIRLRGNKVQIAGRGYGHGVGLCQWGAKFMAKDGKKYKSIIQHFFPGTKVTKIRKSLLALN